MARVPVEPVCDLRMIKAEYRHIEASGRPPFYGCRIVALSMGKPKPSFSCTKMRRTSSQINEFARGSHSSPYPTPAAKLISLKIRSNDHFIAHLGLDPAM